MLISSQTQRKLYTGRWQQYDKDLWELTDVLWWREGNDHQTKVQLVRHGEGTADTRAARRTSSEWME